MCEIRDPGIRWPQFHTLVFEEQVVVDMSVVCPQDVKKMLLKQASPVNWKNWAAKHEHEELKEGVWLGWVPAFLRRKTNKARTARHRSVVRKLVVEGGWWREVRNQKKCANESRGARRQRNIGSGKEESRRTL